MNLVHRSIDNDIDVNDVNDDDIDFHDDDIDVNDVNDNVITMPSANAPGSSRCRWAPRCRASVHRQRRP